MAYPKAKVFHGSVEFEVDTARFAGQYDRAQAWLDNQVITDSNLYAPFRGGDLRKSAIRGTELNSGEVVWDSIYARYQYYGKVMIGPPPKQVTDIPLKYHTPGTGAFWFETAKGLHKQEWLAGVRKIIGGG